MARFAATDEFRSMAEGKAEQEGVAGPEFQSMLDEKIAELDAWLADAPDFVKDVHAQDGGEGGILDGVRSPQA